MNTYIYTYTYLNKRSITLDAGVTVRTLRKIGVVGWSWAGRGKLEMLAGRGLVVGWLVVGWSMAGRSDISYVLISIYLYL